MSAAMKICNNFTVLGQLPPTLPPTQKKKVSPNLTTNPNPNQNPNPNWEGIFLGNNCPDTF